MGARFSGAYNSETGDFMRWKEYIETVGENGNHDYGMGHSVRGEHSQGRVS